MMLLPRQFRDLSALAISGICLLVCSCSRHNSKNSFPPGPAMSPFVHFEFAVYLPPARANTHSEPMRALAESLRDYPRLKRVSDLPKEPQTTLVRAYLNESVKEHYAPPSARSLEY